jgi:hypothetical protein
MADDPTSSKPTRARRAGSIEEALKPLRDSAPRSATKRVRTLDEARRALRIPTTYSPEVLQAQGIPNDFWIAAYRVTDRHHPERVAEFAIGRVVTRTGGRLHPRTRGTRLNLSEASNALWIVYGALALSAHNGLVIETINIGPAYDRQFSNKNDDVARGVTNELLRLIRLPEIITKVVERLDLGTSPTTPVRPQPAETHEPSTTRTAARPHVSQDELIAITKRYLELCQLGERHPLPQLADEFGISRSQARDRVHKARIRHYLAPGDPGRATATPGPALKELGWIPPIAPPKVIV